MSKDVVKKTKTNKGSNWERDLCKFLSKWIDGPDSKRILLWRGRGSGAMFTISNGNIGNDFSGDIYSTSPDSYFLTDNFSIEAKNGYASTSLDKHLKENKKDNLKDFWLQCTSDAKKSNKQPLLIYKKTGLRCPWVGINENTFKKLFDKISEEKYIIMHWTNDIENLYLFEYENFFKMVTPDDIKGIQWK